MQNPGQPGAADTPFQQFPCDQCGAPLQYAPGTQLLRCPYCGHENVIAETSETIVEQDFQQTLAKLADAGRLTERVTNHCTSCGAQYTPDPNVHADSCPFCGAPVVAATERHRHIQPQALLPFQIPHGQAQEMFRHWLQSLWFAPNPLKRYARSDKHLQGVYVPYWTFDAASASTYRGARGDYYQVPQTYQTVQNGRTVTRTRMVTKVRWTPVGGQVSRFFDDVLVLASHALPRRITQRLEPWDLVNLIPYQEHYLSGFRSEMYQVELSQSFDYAKKRMAEVIRQDVIRDMGGDLQRIRQLNTHYSQVHFKHILLPIWVSAFRFKHKAYRFVINGRSGEVQGERPYSLWKIAAAVCIGLLLIGAAVLAWSIFQESQINY
jgi:LSD1 subclass zinc finger protein